MAAILANYRGYQIGDKVDGTVLQQVETGLKYSLVICDYGKAVKMVLLYDRTIFNQSDFKMNVIDMTYNIRQNCIVDLYNCTSNIRVSLHFNIQHSIPVHNRTL